MDTEEQELFYALNKQNEELKNQLMATSVLTEITKIMMSTPNLESVFRTLLLGINETMNYERIALFKVEPDEFILKPIDWIGLEEEEVKKVRVPLSFMDGGEIADSIFLNRPIMVDPASPDDDPLRVWKTKSYIAVPIVTKSFSKCWENSNCDKKECPAHGVPAVNCWCVKGAAQKQKPKDEDDRRKRCVKCEFFKCNYVLFMDKPNQEVLATSDDMIILTTLANQTGIIIDNFQSYENLEQAHNELKSINIKINRINRELKEAQAKINRDLEQASTIQMGLLPQTFPKTDHFDCAATYVPATKVGGDYYDLFEIEKDVFCLLVGDVSGHGISAALIMSMAKILIKSYANVNSAKTTLDKVNTVLTRDIKNDNFITMFYTVLDFRTNKMIYASAGHNPIIMADRTTKELKQIKADGIFLGVFDSAMVSDNELPIKENGRIVLYTDGLTEAENLAGEMYGLERLIEIVKNTLNLTPEETKEEILRDFKQHIQTASVEDDVTLLILDFKK
jgi:serine phosphatase RsbU (regulator of sigma subunit)